MTGTPGGVHRRSPYLGEDTRARLLEAGLSATEIEALISGRVAAAYDSAENSDP
jgi:crotonobetainyl-CoA:carnitine CoA-transferase CaiB-like acyl-CoA transferase